MDFSRDALIPNGEPDFNNIRPPWMQFNTATLAKPIPVRLQEANSRQAPPQFFSALSNGNHSINLGQNHNSVALGGQTHNLAAQNHSIPTLGRQYRNLAVSDGQNFSFAALGGPTLSAGHYIRAMNNRAAVWKDIPGANLSALQQVASDASVPRKQIDSRGMPPNFFPFLPKYPLQPSNHLNNLLLNQNCCVSSNPTSDSNYQPQILQHGFPAPYHPTYNLNCPSRTIADSVSIGATSFQFEPATLDEGKREQNKQSEILRVFLDVRSRQERNILQDGNNFVGNKNTDLHCQEPQLHSVVSSLPNTDPEPFSQPSVDSSAPLSLGEIQNPEKDEANGFDLNKTPQQKPKRKKIRPRVVRENQPKRNPKSTEKQGTLKEDQPAKRKYVRKAATNSPSTPPGNNMREISDPYTRPNKLCKRSLNFSWEGQAEGQESHHTTVAHLKKKQHSSNKDSISMLAFNTIPKSQTELPSRIKNSLGNKSALQLAQGLEVREDNLSAGNTFDLNCFLTQMLNDCISLPTKQNPSTQAPICITSSRENMIHDMRTSGESHNRCEVPETTRSYGSHTEFVRNNNRENMIHDTRTSGESHNRCEVPETTRSYGSHTEFVRTNNSTVSSMSHQYIHPASNSQNNTNYNQRLPMPREYPHTLKMGQGHLYSQEEAQLQSLNPIGAKLETIVQFPEIHKKRRVENSQQMLGANQSSSVVIPAESAKEVMMNQQRCTSNGTLTSQGYNGCLGVQFSNINCTENLSNGASNYLQKHSSLCSLPQATRSMHYGQNISTDLLSRKQTSKGSTHSEVQEANNYLHEYYSLSPESVTTRPMHYMQSNLADLFPCKEGSTSAGSNHFQSPATQPVHYMQSIIADLLSHKEASSSAAHKTQASDFITNGQMERIMKKRSKEPIRVRDFASLTAVSACDNFPPTQPISCLKKSDSNNNATNIGNLQTYSDTNGVRLLDTQALAYNWHQSLGKTKDAEKKLHVSLPVDQVTQKLNSINTEEQNALVPYTGNGQIVAYEGLFDPTKKRKPRAKVDLDPETERVWKLLMGNECDAGVESTDAEKQKWWEEERQVFRGRANSFIARMHLIQGDRRFTKWNGSVVDSVVGVFLTQNVSDHLSSSAFMSLAAHFPLEPRSDEGTCNRGRRMHVEEPDVSIVDSDENKGHNSMREPINNESFITSHQVQYVENKNMCNNNTSFGSNAGAGSCGDTTKCKKNFMGGNTPDVCHGQKNIAVGNSVTDAEYVSLAETDDSKLLQSSGVSSPNSVYSSIQITTVTNPGIESVKLLGGNRVTMEDFVSSHSSVNSSIAHTDAIARSSSDSNSEEEDLTTGCKPNSTSATFLELLQRADTAIVQECNSKESGSFSLDLRSEMFSKHSEKSKYDKRESNMDRIYRKTESLSIYSSNTEFPLTQTPAAPSSNYSLHRTSHSGVQEVECPGVIGSESTFALPSTTESIEIKGIDNTSEIIGSVTETMSDPEKVAYSRCNHQLVRSKTLNNKSDPSTGPQILYNAPTETNQNKDQQTSSSLPNPHRQSSNMVGRMSLEGQQKSKLDKVGESSKTTDTTINPRQAKQKPVKEDKHEFDWDSLRKEVYHRCGRKNKNHETMDSLDWEAVRCADVNEIARSIKERGMNHMLAERIKGFLNRLVKEHGSIDLEWLRDIPPDKAKEYLLSVRGLGLKSVECVRLLTLHHLAFPVDTNVGRIAVRLGWVPLQPLPESLQLHLLELYPIQETIQKYLWPRLCTLDQRTLYELHYQLITFGKVFCTKSKPNCNACPMRAECKHFASAFASARLALPGPAEEGIINSTIPMNDNQSSLVHSNLMPFSQMENDINQNPVVRVNPLPLPPTETNTSDTKSKINSEPIIEVPATPEHEYTEVLESDIEDAFHDDPDEIPRIELSIKDFANNLQNYMQENNMKIQEVDMSKALVALTTDAASIPTPKLKNVSRLRTEHQVYELPDSHPLLKGVEKRVPNDVGSYLLAIWTPGETAESTQAPRRCCDSQTSGDLCNEKTCFSCNSIREANSQTVRGTLLIPCKTAMKGSFPLNGTYFQVNEVFADHDSSHNPINVPRDWLWNLPRSTVFFGTSVTSIFRGQTTAEIQSCFWRGYVCVRGFDRKKRVPRPLLARLHFTASRLTKRKTGNEE